MTVRTPLYHDDTSAGSTPILKQMSGGQITAVKNAFKQLYFQSPSVRLNVIPSGGGNMRLPDSSAMTNTRLVAGAYSTDPTTFPNEETTQEPQIQTVEYDRLNQTIESVTQPTNASNIEYPIYYYTDGSSQPVLRSMTLQDMYDTFAEDVVTNDLSVGGAVYTVSTSTTEAGYTEVSGDETPIFLDTRANPAGYNAAEIPETEDSTTTQEIQNYYLHKKNYVTPAYQAPARLTSTGNIITPSTETWNTVFQSIIRYVAANVEGYRLSYSINGSGSTCGTAMTDTRLEGGDGVYQTFGAGGDDYRAQEFPDGSSTIISTYELKVNQT